MTSSDRIRYNGLKYRYERLMKKGFIRIGQPIAKETSRELNRKFAINSIAVDDFTIKVQLVKCNYCGWEGNEDELIDVSPTFNAMVCPECSAHEELEDIN